MVELCSLVADPPAPDQKTLPIAHLWSQYDERLFLLYAASLFIGMTVNAKRR